MKLGDSGEAAHGPAFTLGSKICVYGSLRPGAYAYHIMRGSSRHIGEVTIPNAAIYSLGGFPGLKQKEGCQVVGDLLEITDASLPARLDQYEGYPDFYTRQVIETSEGPAWVYLFNGEVSEDQFVQSGDWLNRDRKAA